MTIDLKRIPWGPDVEPFIERLKPWCGIEALKARVEAGAVSIYEIVCEKRRLAILITRIDALIDGRQELVIMHAIGNFKTAQNLVGVLSPVFDELARTNKVNVVRVHTQRKGMDALLEENGYSFIENVYKKEVF